MCPGFIQGLTKKEMISLFKSRVTTSHHSISIDGSAFDSSQLAAIMEITDNVFWKGIQSHVEKFLEYNDFEDPVNQASKLVSEA